MQGTKNDAENNSQLQVPYPAWSKKHLGEPALKLAFPGQT